MFRLLITRTKCFLDRLGAYADGLMAKCIAIILALLASQLVNAATVTYDFSGGSPLEDFSQLNNAYHVTNGELIPPLVAYIYSTQLTLNTRVSGGAGKTIVLAADFLYDTALINPNPQEVAGLSLQIDAWSGGSASGEVRALGSLNRDIVAYTFTYDVNSRNEGNPVVQLLDDTWYRLIFGMELIGGQFGDHLLMRTDLFQLGTDHPQLVSTFSVDSYNWRMFDPTLVVRLGAQGSAGIAAIDNFSVSVVPIPAAAWLFGSALGVMGWMRRRAVA